MSPEHFDAIAEIYAALSRRDLAALRSSEAVHPEFSWQSAPEEPDTTVRRGASTMAHSSEILETFDRIDIQIAERIDLGPEAAIVVVSLNVRGAASGAGIERSEAHLWTVRDGRLASLREFSSVEDARAAAAQ